MTAPEPGAGHVPRNALLQQLDAAIERRFALLQAPAGFGKTTALADLSRKKRDEALLVLVAWISLDENDAPNVFIGYLAYALACAGLDLSALNEDDGWPSSPAAYQIGTLARALDRHAAPCLLVLDEVDRLPRETVQMVQQLVEHGPGNLHFALAFRSNPGLDLACRSSTAPASSSGPTSSASRERRSPDSSPAGSCRDADSTRSRIRPPAGRSH